jgi:hypothetical protein
LALQVKKTSVLSDEAFSELGWLVLLAKNTTDATRAEFQSIHSQLIMALDR